MAQRSPTALRGLLPNVLARLSRESGDASHLVPVWADIVGAVTALHSRPIALDGKALVVRVDSPRWSQELRLQEPDLLRRFAERLGDGAITGLVYRSVEPK
jgi:predicted nucleic acid-binding Zn ribbon protein